MSSRIKNELILY